MKQPIPQRSLIFTKQLRTNQTLWEKKLWKKLRAGRFYGLKFKRQHLIGNYIVDFYCHSKKLIIEIDGVKHKQSVADKFRDNALSRQGYTVLRFWNSQIDRDLEKLLEKIKLTSEI